MRCRSKRTWTIPGPCGNVDRAQDMSDGYKAPERPLSSAHAPSRGWIEHVVADCETPGHALGCVTTCSAMLFQCNDLRTGQSSRMQSITSSVSGETPHVACISKPDPRDSITRKRWRVSRMPLGDGQLACFQSRRGTLLNSQMSRGYIRWKRPSRLPLARMSLRICAAGGPNRSHRPLSRNDDQARHGSD